MADYKRLDYNGALYLVNYLLQKLANSPLADGTTYTIEASGANLLLKDGEGTTVTTLNDVLVTSAMATKINGIAEGAAANIIESITVNGTAVTPDANKAVALTIPTDNASLANGAGYQTAREVTTAINSALSTFTGGITFAIVTDKASLPTEGAQGTIYLVPNSSLTGDSYYDEYFWDATNSRYEMFGSTRVDLSGYVLASEMSTITNSEINTLVDEAYDAVFNPTPTP